jgi:hypothetical protein
MPQQLPPHGHGTDGAAGTQVNNQRHHSYGRPPPELPPSSTGSAALAPVSHPLTVLPVAANGPRWSIMNQPCNDPACGDPFCETARTPEWYEFNRRIAIDGITFIVTLIAGFLIGKFA